MRSWEEIRNWRRETRAMLLARRLAVRRQQRDQVKQCVVDSLLHHIPELRAGAIGFCWPFKGEIDVRDLVSECLATGAEAALPVVVERGQPLEFWSWRPRMELKRGVWDIPIPAERQVARPTILLVPLVGFDGAGYRLGYGGGYYDRTLAAAAPRPLAIGVGYGLGRLETIHPQSHDVPMDAIVTEAGFAWMGDARPASSVRRPAASDEGDVPRSCASPPCLMGELEPSAFGFMSQAETLDLLNRLLEGERAGARAVGAMYAETGIARNVTVLRGIAMDEARFCAMLTRHIVRLGGSPSRATGAFYDKLLAVHDPTERLELLNRGQGWVVRKLQEALPKIHDDGLHHDLKQMLDRHELNIADCTLLQNDRPPLDAGPGVRA